MNGVERDGREEAGVGTGEGNWENLN